MTITAFQTAAIRAGFDQMAQAARGAGDLNAAARLEVCREYFTNPAFKHALQDHLWRLNNPTNA